MAGHLTVFVLVRVSNSLVTSGYTQSQAPPVLRLGGITDGVAAPQPTMDLIIMQRRLKPIHICGYQPDSGLAEVDENRTHQTR